MEIILNTMGHVKIISYANTVEIYEYERTVIPLYGRGRRVRKSTSHAENCGISGEDSLSDKDTGDKTKGKRTDNARRASMAFRRIVASNLDGSALPILVTLTYRDNYTDLKGSYRHFSSFVQSLRRKYGDTFKYICVPEFQKRGAVHFHALFWGLPEEVLPLERKTRALATIWGKGFVYLKPTDGNEKLSHYLSKYMAKAFTDPRLKNQKCYVASRNIVRPLIQSGDFPIDEVLRQYEITEDAVVDREYTTHWLGKGRYRIFKL